VTRAGRATRVLAAVCGLALASLAVGRAGAEREASAEASEDPPAQSPAAPASATPLGELAGSLGLESLKSDAPISISADELEALSRKGQRQLEFRGHVHVTQAELSLRSDRLKAFYPPGGSQPERLVAEGSVQLVQGESRARCDHATYEVTREYLVCQGNAELQDGQNSLRGDSVEFDLAEERVVVKGNAYVVIHPEPKGSEPGGAPPTAESPAR
jgi:lipopolysaccharide transport protein LptA